MKSYWKSWEDGWMVGFNYLWFGCVLAFFCCPITIVRLVLEKLDFPSHSGSHHWKLLVEVLITIAWLPTAFGKAAAFTGNFLEKEDDQTQPVEPCRASDN